jgi:uncharacterized membrane protein (DUF4010 family)
MDTWEPYASLALVLAVGFLIGLQREQSMAGEGPGRRTFVGGIRTFPLVALAGGVATLLARGLGPWITLVTFLLLAVPVAIAYADDIRQGRDRGLTSETAFVVTFLLGALGLSEGILPPEVNRQLLVASLGVAVTALLSMKEALHDWAARVSKEDLYATVKFLVVAVIVLPILPNKTWDPLEVLNPFHIGLMITLIAGLGFAGYVAFRMLGPGRGLAMTGLLGGLVSSTAVTLSLSGRAKEHPGIADACAAGMVLAWTVMCPRVLAAVAVVHPDLARRLALPLGAAAVAGALASALLYRKTRAAAAEAEPVVLKNPFELGTAVKFGALFALVLVLSKLAVDQWQGTGLVVTGALAGTTDVDAVSLSAAKLAHGGVGLGIAAAAILVACGSNTLVKAGIAWTVAGWAFGRRVLPAVLAMLVAGTAGALASWKLAS